jgi:hypothetical protein
VLVMRDVCDDGIDPLVPEWELACTLDIINVVNHIDLSYNTTQYQMWSDYINTYWPAKGMEG